MTHKQVRSPAAVAAASPRSRRLPLRTAAAVLVGRAVAGLSRVLRQGRGSAVSGEIALRIDPDALSSLAAERVVIMITGTNGKTTTTWMTAEALRSTGRVATNREGSNMLAGAVAALAAAPRGSPAVLEVDEIALPALTQASRPAVIALMNLSREFTRGVSLGRTIRAWREMVTAISWPCTIVANADDPLIVWALSSRSESVSVLWVGAGLRWLGDTRRCPACGGVMTHSELWWGCERGDLERPEPAWQLMDGIAIGPDREQPITVAGPGGWLQSNALFTFAIASTVGVSAGDAAAAVAAVDDVDGRYRLIRRGSHQVRITMVKNPASWSEALTLSRERGRLVLVVDQFGVKDTLSLWDADGIGPQLGRVTVSGHRYADIAARLEAAGVEFDVEPDPLAGIDAAPPGPVHLIANYSAMIALKKRLLT